MTPNPEPIPATKCPFEITPPCCDVWKEIRTDFGWFVPEEYQEFRVMPYMRGSISKWRVNHCPSCGASRRDCTESGDMYE